MQPKPRAIIQLLAAALLAAVCTIAALAMPGLLAGIPETPIRIGTQPVATPPGRQTTSPAGTDAATSRPVPTAVPSTPTPLPPNAVLVFTDDFRGECNLLEGDNERRTFKCDNGEYSMLSKVEGSRWVFYVDEYRDVVIEVDARLVSGPQFVEYGLVFRTSSDGKHFYGFTITRDGQYALFRYQETRFTDLIRYSASSAVKPGGSVNTLKVIAQGTQIALYVNDRWLNTITDSTLASGTLGFFLSNREPNARVALSRMRVSEIKRPFDLPAAAPSPRPTR